MTTETVKTILTILPLLWLAYALIFRVTRPHIACFISLLIVTIGSLTVWKISYNILFWSIIDGIIFSLYPIIWTVFSALFTYRVICETGAIDGIKRSLSGISDNKIIQAFIVAFCFGSLLEGIAGFGTSVIVPSAILLSLGFPPYQSAIISLVSNTVPVVYAAVGVPIIALARVTSLPLKTLSGTIGLQLFPIALVLPFIIKREIKEDISFLLVLGTGLVFASTQGIVGWFIGPELPAILAPFFTIAFLLVYLKLKGKDYNILREDLKSWIPYGLIVLFILITRFNNNLSNILSNPPFSVSFLIDPLNKTIKIDFLYTPGTIIMISTFIGGLALNAKISDYKKAFVGAFLQILPTFSVITSMILIANIMNYTGMTKLLAIKLISVFGSLYPFVSPFLGAIGTFLGGSDTTSNILFGSLQTEAARSINISPIWLASANATGATGGKLISLQNLTLAVSGINKKGEEGKLMRMIFPYFLLYIVIVGVIIYTGAKIPF